MGSGSVHIQGVSAFEGISQGTLESWDLTASRRLSSPETPEELPEGLDEDEIPELVLGHEGLEDLLVQLPVVADEGPDLLLGQPAFAVQERGDGLRILTVEKTSLVQKIEALLGVEVELLDPEEDLLVCQALLTMPRR